MNIFNSWEGAIDIDGTAYNTYSEIPSDINLRDGMHIILKSKQNSKRLQAATSSDEEYMIEVKPYMLKRSNPDFAFMQQWNDDEPMPMKIMVGSIVKETKGMYRMNLRAEIIGDKMYVCMKCGRALSNPVSQYFGIGPECGGHNYVNPFDTEVELRNAVNEYKKQLMNVTWEGWIPKSAITTMKPFTKE